MAEQQNERCEKCGSDDVLVRWHRASKYRTECERYRSVLDPGPKSHKEHLHFHCRRCQYEWIGPILKQVAREATVGAGRKARPAAAGSADGGTG